MKISVLTVFPDLYQPFFATSLVARAQERGIASFEAVGFTDFCEPKERLDGPTVGHGAGMAIRPEVVERAVTDLEANHGKAYKIFLTPQGRKLDQPLARQLAATFQTQQHIMVVAGRYEGIDARAQELYADLELSIGDYILMGGDLPAMVLLETVLRLIPGVVGKVASIEHDSFSDAFLDFPPYTVPPRVWKDKAIPEVLLSGNHALMETWRQQVAAQRSVKEHFSWVRAHCKTVDEKKRAAEYIPHHYMALLHDEVIVEEGRVGTSSVTSLDIHDLARSGRTYGIKNCFIVTPLADQQKIVTKILHFWHTAGIEYNNQRHDAVKIIECVDSLNAAKNAIEAKEGQKPLVIGTSARATDHERVITYHDQTRVWAHNKPVLFIFGTAQGIAPAVLDQCDYLLVPVEGFSDFNHLSVRSAVAIILDRWLGINPD